ncbi:Uncharacterised protein [Salmonella enterica subsp. arizonae]|uniref:Uncharacterized protein n=1 Tax=Salmonella enterica subsp. arizonae TaxID=59203 RepID=A0A379TBH0_SALER|nr:Uncharacterised protein [Salmonella enterica subsp. arizonae]
MLKALPHGASTLAVLSRLMPGTCWAVQFQVLNRLPVTHPEPAWRKEYGDAVVSPEDAYRNNLRGVCVHQYDDGGLLSINAIALSGAVLQQTKRFLNDAEGKPDWPENDTACDALLEDSGFISTIVANAAGAPFSWTDSQNNRVATFYDVSGATCRPDSATGRTDYAAHPCWKTLLLTP